ncbi:MAG: type II toxin-antitoxin system ParD family antitoxin [Rickettsiales bacterium]
MNVSLTPELEQFIESKVKSGFYGSASEVIREGLRLLDEQDTIKKKRIEMLNLEIDKGLSSLKSGNVISGEEAIRQLKERRASYKQA